MTDRLTSVTDWNSNAIAYAYDDAGRMTTKTLPSGTGVVSSYTYDTADRLTGISHVKGGSTTIASVSYTLDDVGNRTERVDQQGTHTYAYDDLYRLTSVTYPGPATTTYEFDAFGNRLTMTNAAGTTDYDYDDADRLTEVDGPATSPVAYTWDDNGSLTNRGSDTFAWDYQERMTSATVNSVTTTFAYRGDGLRNSRTTGGNTTTFTWDIAAGLPVVIDDGARYVYGAGLEAQVAGSNTYYYLADGLGSTMKTVDASGNVVNSYTYDVYGKKTTSTGSQANEFDFAGQQTDPTGLQYLRARYMDPETGVFVSREPLGILPGWRGNHYGYGAGSPAMLSDPAGTMPCMDIEGPCGGGTQNPPTPPPPPPDFADGNYPDENEPSVYAVCAGLYYYQHQHCLDALDPTGWADIGRGLVDLLDEYSDDAVRLQLEVAGANFVNAPYHQAMKRCALDRTCRGSLNGALNAADSLDDLGVVLVGSGAVGATLAEIITLAQAAKGGMVYAAFVTNWRVYQYAYKPED